MRRRLAEESGAWSALHCNAEPGRPLDADPRSSGESLAESLAPCPVALRRETKPATRRPPPRPRPVKPVPDAPRSRAEVVHYGALQQRGPRRLEFISAGLCGRLVGRSDLKSGRDGLKFVRPQDQLAQAANKGRIELRLALADDFCSSIAQIASHPPAASWLRLFQNRSGCKPTFQLLGGSSDLVQLPLHRSGRGS